jgi:tetratricopeptide (TPR) repeat protein
MGAAVRLWQSRAAQETGCERAEATRRAGIAAQRSDAAKLAEPKFLDALAQFREAGDPRGEAQALGSLADDRHLRGRNSEAATGPEEALELLRECGDWRAAAIVLSNRAVLRMETGNRQEAAAAMREALEVALAAGDAADGTIVLSNLGPAQVYLGFWRRPKRPAAPSWTVAVPPATGAQPRKRRPILRTPSCGRGGSPT